MKNKNTRRSHNMIGHGHSTVIKYLDNDDREAFNLFDKDSSGYIDPKVLLTTLHPLVGDCCKLLEADHLYPTSSLMRRSVSIYCSCANWGENHREARRKTGIMKKWKNVKRNKGIKKIMSYFILSSFIPLFELLIHSFLSFFFVFLSLGFPVCFARLELFYCGPWIVPIFSP